MRCKKIEDLLVLYVQGDLPDRHRKAVKEHLVSCARCSESAEFYRLLDPLTKSLFEERLQEVSEADWDRVWQGIYAEITSQPVLKPSLTRKLFLPVLQRRWLAPALASALAVLVLILLGPFKGKETFEPEGVEVAKQEIPSSIEDKGIRTVEEGMGDFLSKDMDDMVQLAAQRLWEMELEEIKAWDDRESPLLALQDTLEYLGEEVDYDYLRFASGSGFRFFFHRASLGQEQEYSMAVMENASAAYGYSSQWVVNQDFSSTLETIKESIRQNRPVFTVGMVSSGRRGYAMIIAYNGDEGSLQVKRYGKGQSPEYAWIPLPHKEWQAPFYEYQDMVKMPLFIMGEKGEVPSRKEVAKKVLYQAVEFTRGRDNSDTGYYSGLAAYKQWIAILQEERKPEQEVTWRQAIMRVSYNPLGDIIRRNQVARNCIVLIAQEIGQEEAKEYLLAAASNYTNMTTTADQLRDLMRCKAMQVDHRSSCELGNIASENEAIAARAAALVQDMLASEEAAIAGLQKAIKIA